MTVSGKGFDHLRVNPKVHKGLPYHGPYGPYLVQGSANEDNVLFLNRHDVSYYADVAFQSFVTEKDIIDGLHGI